MTVRKQPAASTEATTDLLVEIGCEELPPKSLAALGRAFHEALAKTLLNDADLRSSTTHSEAFWSPRRLAVLITGIRAVQGERTVERLGPAMSAAYDKDGKPTKAAEGFARSCGVALEQLGQQDSKLHFRTTLPGQPLTALAADAVRAALATLPTPKRMRWGDSEVEFLRPVHWVVLLVGDAAIDAEVLGVKAGRDSRGHRHHHPGKVTLAKPAQYREALKQAKVWLDGERCDLRDEIVRQVGALAAKAGGRAPGLARDAALVAEVAALCEWPVAMLGGFDARFLELPPEVLTLTLEHHQRYFPLFSDKPGTGGPGATLLPRFVFVANVESKQPQLVVAGNERVIVPRLSDAFFFWNRDKAIPLLDRAANLPGVTFQKQLGNYADKFGRITRVAQALSPQLGIERDAVARTAILSRADLLTFLVGEFPELQGTVGKHLARVQGEPEAVASAIEEIYLPRFAEDRLPATSLGRALSLADRLDTVCGIFSIGQRPTGDKDPFALRRLALGALRISIECKLDLDFASLIGNAYREFVPTPKDGELEIVFDFFLDRLTAYYQAKGIRIDVVRAVIDNDRTPFRPLDIDARIHAVGAFLGLPEAAALAAANKRIANILKQAGATSGTVDPALLTEPGELALHAALASGEVEWVRGLLEQGAYESALRKLAALRGPVDQFFDGVMVMADDPRVRANRLALLAQLQALFLHTADLAQLQVEP